MKSVCESQSFHGRILEVIFLGVVWMAVLNAPARADGLYCQADISTAVVGMSSIKARLGADVRAITSKEAEKYGQSSKEGVAIFWLDPDGPLTSAGFEVNDLILEINCKTVKGPEGFSDLMDTLKPQQRIILLGLDHRSGRTGYVQVMLH